MTHPTPFASRRDERVVLHAGRPRPRHRRANARHEGDA